MSERERMPGRALLLNVKGRILDTIRESGESGRDSRTIYSTLGESYIDRCDDGDDAAEETEPVCYKSRRDRGIWINELESMQINPEHDKESTASAMLSMPDCISRHSELPAAGQEQDEHRHTTCIEPIPPTCSSSTVMSSAQFQRVRLRAIDKRRRCNQSRRAALQAYPGRFSPRPCSKQSKSRASNVPTRYSTRPTNQAAVAAAAAAPVTRQRSPDPNVLQLQESDLGKQPDDKASYSTSFFSLRKPQRKLKRALMFLFLLASICLLCIAAALIYVTHRGKTVNV